MGKLFKQEKVPSQFLDVADLDNIQEWNTAAFNLITSNQIPVFRNCIFKTSDLLKLASIVPQGGVLNFSLIYLVNDQDSAEQAALLAYPLDDRDLPYTNDALFLLPEEVNSNVIGYEIADWEQRDLIVIKQPDNQELRAPSAFKPENVNDNLQLWLEGFDIRAALSNYQSTISVGNFMEDFHRMHISFDMTLLKELLVQETTGENQEIIFSKVALFPLVLYSDGTVSTGGAPSHYVTLILAPLDTENNLQTYSTDASGKLVLDTAGGFLVSGCFYPRPWFPSFNHLCTDTSLKINITDF